MQPDLSEGQRFSVPYPFIREEVEIPDIDGWVKTKSWRPGVRFELVAPGDSEAVADAVGWQILTIVSLHKPGHYPMRVFYTRQWTAPSGKKFGKTGKLRIATTGAFRRLVRGYRYGYRLESADAATAA